MCDYVAMQILFITVTITREHILLTVTIMQVHILVIITHEPILENCAQEGMVDCCR